MYAETGREPPSLNFGQSQTVGGFKRWSKLRVVANLVLNACEAVSPDSGQIIVTSTGDRARLQIGVLDNGPGIPRRFRTQFFEPFVSYGKAEGSGLGLTIVKKIVEIIMVGRSTLMGEVGPGFYSESRFPLPFPTEESRLPSARGEERRIPSVF